MSVRRAETPGGKYFAAREPNQERSRGADGQLAIRTTTPFVAEAVATRIGLSDGGGVDDGPGAMPEPG